MIGDLEVFILGFLSREFNSEYNKHRKEIARTDCVAIISCYEML